MNNISPMKKVFAVFFGLLGLAGLILLIFLVGQRQDQRSRADKATVINFADTTEDVAPGDQFDLEVKIDPGSNQVSIVELVVKYDEDVLTIDESGFEKTITNLDLVTEPSVNNGEIKISLSLAGGNATNVIKNAGSLGILSFTVNEDAPAGDTRVIVDTTKTQVRSLLGRDEYGENVLSSGGSAVFKVTGGVCKPNIGTCDWDPAENATNYSYLITRSVGETFEEVLKGETSKTQVEFPTKPGEKYICTVKALNECGESGLADGTSTCPTPTPTLSPSPSPSVTVSPSPSPTVSPTATPQPSITVIVSQPPEVVEVEVPGQEVVVEVPGEQIVTTVTPAPSLPPTGNPVVMGGILGGVLFVLGGLALLFL